MSKQLMIDEHLSSRGITAPQVLKAMNEVDRKFFIPEEMRPHAYADSPLPIGKGQTISQPYIVAYMAQALEIEPEMTVLEIGTGCGYNAAVLSRIAKQVYSLEIIKWLADYSQKNLERANIKNVDVTYTDGFKGLPSKAPFDRIVLTAAIPEVPETLKNQLKDGGKLLTPLGERTQELVLIEKVDDELYREKTLLPVRFVPMTSELR